MPGEISRSFETSSKNVAVRPSVLHTVRSRILIIIIMFLSWDAGSVGSTNVFVPYTALAKQRWLNKCFAKQLFTIPTL